MNLKTDECKIFILSNSHTAVRNTDAFVLDYKSHRMNVSVGKRYKDNFVFINEIKRK